MTTMMFCLDPSSEEMQLLLQTFEAEVLRQREFATPLAQPVYSSYSRSMSPNVYVTAGRVHIAGTPRPPKSTETNVNASLRNVRHNISNLYALGVNYLRPQPEPARPCVHPDYQLELHFTDHGRVSDLIAEAMEEEMDRIELSDSENDDGYVFKGFPSSFARSSSRGSTPIPGESTEANSNKSTSTKSTSTSTEPFPDYDDPGEDGHLYPSSVEERYRYAVGKTAEEVNRFKVIDARIACGLVFLPDYLKLLHADETNATTRTLAPETVTKGTSSSNNKTDDDDSTNPQTTTVVKSPSPKSTRATSPRSYFKWDKNDRPVPEGTKVHRLNEMHAALLNPNLKPDIRDRFLVYAESFISIERTLFGDTDLNRRAFLGPDVLVKVHMLIQPILKYLARVEEIVYKEVCDVERARDKVKWILLHYDLPSYQRYAEIARTMVRCVPRMELGAQGRGQKHVETEHVVELASRARVYRKPDRELLMCTLRLFEALLYDDFLIVRQHKNLDEDNGEFRTEISRLIVRGWGILGRIVMHYERFAEIHESIFRRYVTPASMEVLNAQKIWDQQKRLYGHELRQLRDVAPLRCCLDIDQCLSDYDSA